WRHPLRVLFFRLHDEATARRLEAPMATTARLFEDLATPRGDLRREDRRVGQLVPQAMVRDRDHYVGLVLRGRVGAAREHLVQAVARFPDFPTDLIEQTRVVVVDDATDVAAVADVEGV